MAGGQPPLTETAFVLGAQQPEGQRYRRRGQGLERRGLRTQWKKGSRKKKAQMAQPRLPGPVQNAFPDSTVNSVQARTDLPYGEAWWHTASSSPYETGWRAHGEVTAPLLFVSAGPRRAKGFRGNKLRQRAMQPPQTPRTVPHAPYNNNEFLVADKYRRAGMRPCSRVPYLGHGLPSNSCVSCICFTSYMCVERSCKRCLAGTPAVSLARGTTRVCQLGQVRLLLHSAVVNLAVDCCRTQTCQGAAYASGDTGSSCGFSPPPLPRTV